MQGYVTSVRSFKTHPNGEFFMRKFALVAVLSSLFASASSFAGQGWFQPGPSSGVDTYVYSGNVAGVYGNSEVLKLGYDAIGSNHVLIKIRPADLRDLPRTITGAWLYLYQDPSSGSPVDGAYQITQVAGDWSESSAYVSPKLLGTTGPSFGYSATLGQPFSFTITDMYNSWQNGVKNSGGIIQRGKPVGYFASSDAGGIRQWSRPQFVVNYNSIAPNPNFDMPLNRSKSWLVTTEIGGHDCKNSGYPDEASGIDLAHTDDAPSGTGGYWSIDLAPSTKDHADVREDFTGVDVLVLAAADGYVSNIEYGITGVGKRLTITHSNGYDTRYLHLESFDSSMYVGKPVSSGETIGLMGTGDGLYGKHLHFTVRYNGTSFSSQEELRQATLGGAFLAHFRTECVGGTWVGFKP